MAKVPKDFLKIILSQKATSNILEAAISPQVNTTQNDRAATYGTNFNLTSLELEREIKPVNPGIIDVEEFMCRLAEEARSNKVFADYRHSYEVHNTLLRNFPKGVYVYDNKYHIRIGNRFNADNKLDTKRIELAAEFHGNNAITVNSEFVSVDKSFFDNKDNLHSLIRVMKNVFETRVSDRSR